MKEYEFAYRYKLPRRLPIIIRLDGCHFHTFTRGMERPFDTGLAESLWNAAMYVCSQVMGCKLAYVQSDEVSLLLTNYDKLTTQGWFDNNLQKLVSVSASMITAKFNSEIRRAYPDKEFATFDARAFVLPHDEVTNYFWWRQRDATKNSVSALAQSHFPHRDLQNLSTSQLQDKLVLEQGVNWNDIPTWQKRGVCIVKEVYMGNNDTERTRWTVDREVPLFTQKSRNYIDRYVYLESRKEGDKTDGELQES